MLGEERDRLRGAVFAVVSTIIALFVGIIITVNFINSVTPDTSWTTEANTTWANTQTYTWVAMGLIAIGILVLGAVAVLAAMGSFGTT